MKTKNLFTTIILTLIILTGCRNNTAEVEYKYKEITNAAKNNDTVFLLDAFPFLSSMPDGKQTEILTDLIELLKKDMPYKIYFQSENSATLRRNDGFVLVFTKTETQGWVVSRDITIRQTIDIIPAKK